MVTNLKQNFNVMTSKSSPKKESLPTNPFLQRSSLYQEFLAEREEILRHKWLESEKAGRDIGFERALLDWIRKHRDDWRNQRRTDSTNSKSA